jgi:hypothetical protein
MLIEQLTVKDPPTRQHLVPAQLVVRESTGPAPRARTSDAPPAPEPVASLDR